MTLLRGSNRNTNDTATISAAVALNSSTSTTIVSASADRIMVIIYNNGPSDVWLKLQAASVDDLKKGIRLPTRAVYEMPTDNVYTGEISAIALANSPDIYVTEY